MAEGGRLRDLGASLDLRVAELEEEVRRVREEVEACAVLVLSLDAASTTARAATAASGSVSHAESLEGGTSKEVAARLAVLEDAWALRSTTVARHADEAVARLEAEFVSVWRELRTQEAARAPAQRALEELQRGLAELRAGLSEVRGQSAAVAESVAAAERRGPGAEAVEALVAKVMEEVGKTASSLEDRFHQVGTLAEGADLQARRQDQLEQTMELLVHQRREDEQKVQAQARAVDSRFRELERRERAEGSWRIEAQAIRDELEDLRTSRFPAVCQQFTRTAQSLSEGLQALREEVQGQAVSASQPKALGALGTGDAASLRAEISELRDRLLRELSGGLDGRLATLRADVAAEVGTAVLETREAWTAASRRLSALEASAAEANTARPRGRGCP